MDDSVATRLLVNQLRSGKADLRIEAAYLLAGQTLDEDGLAALRLALQDDEAVVRDQAAIALAESGDTASLRHLVHLVDTSRPAEAKGVAWAIRRLGDLADAEGREAARHALERYAKRSRGRSRQHARALLGQGMGDGSG